MKDLLIATWELVDYSMQVEGQEKKYIQWGKAYQLPYLYS